MPDDLARANELASAAMSHRRRLAAWFAEQAPNHPSRAQSMWEAQQEEQRALDELVFARGQSSMKGSNMAKATEPQIFKNGALQPIVEEPPPSRREEIARYIERRLGPELGKLYHDAIAQAVDGGYYDADWQASGAHPGIERYLNILREDFMSKHAGQEYLLQRLLVKLDYGTDEEKRQLKQLLGL